MAKKTSFRKCHFSLCSFEINLNTDKTIKIDNKFYHFDCYVNYLITKKKTTKVEAELETEPLYQETVKYLKNEKDKDELDKFIKKQYEMIMLPSYLYTKLDAIYKGEFKGMTRPIPACDLLDMWDRKWTFLCTASGNKGLDDIHRINYDIAILLNKASSYYKWKEQGGFVQKEVEHTLSTKKTDYEELSKKVKHEESYIIEDNYD